MEPMEDYVFRLNGYSDKEIEDLIKNDKCPYEPERDDGVSIGMYHCPICGEMVLAGMTHPRYSNMETPTPYTDEWPEYDNGSDAFSMDDSWLDRTGSVKKPQ